MDFFKTWLTGYYNPGKLAGELAEKKAPHWGVYATGMRGLLNSLLLYLPLVILGKEPTSPSWLTFLPTTDYYLASVFFVPFFFYFQWFLLSAFIHLVIRLSGLQSNIDHILNITGFNSLVVGAFILVWDWIWILTGWHNPPLLGISHLIIDTWYIIITSACFIRILNLKPITAVLLNLLWIVVAVPIAMLFMRAPV
ncbi:MAG: hypothetical protein AMS27_12085 [Bacteroides sp. SM23_62_1]|nr:MAG: hypothetical protein AMS27_12085 [Bacteroides sp. SM23_62_1]